MSFFTDEQLTFLASNTVRVDFLVKLEFVSETVYAWNGHYPLTVNGHTYKPLHGIAQIEGLGATANGQSEAVTFRLSGIQGQDPDILALAIEQTPEANQQFVTIYLQLFDEDWQPKGAPIAAWFGFLQPPKVSRTAQTEMDGSQQEISISAENAFFNRSRPPYGRYTDRDQQKRYPGDTGFQFVPGLINKQITWPDY